VKETVLQETVLQETVLQRTVPQETVLLISPGSLVSASMGTSRLVFRRTRALSLRERR
jgi:hypothetical protein